ncbi:glutathione S-transferase T3-like protein [Tanacetum coccineum]
MRYGSRSLIRHAWTQAEELLLAKSFIQISEDPKIRCDQKLATFWYKILDVYNQEANKKGFQEHTKNMLTGKWTPMNAAVMKFNQLYEETLAHSGENDENHMARVLQLYKTIVRGEFKHQSAWNFLKDRHKWKNPESTLQRRSRLRGTDKEPNHFGDDELPRPPGLQRIAKSQRSGSNSTASSGSNPIAYQELMAEQYDLDRKAKMQVLSQESENRRRLIQSQKIAEDMKVLQIDTSGMDPTYAAIINAQKEQIRAEYLPSN